MKVGTQIINNLNRKDYSVDLNKLVEGTEADDFYYACNDIEQQLFKLEKRVHNQDVLDKLYKLVIDLNSIRMTYYKELDGKDKDVDDELYEDVGETFTIPKEIVDKVRAEFKEAEPEIKAEIKQELDDFIKNLKSSGFSDEEINNLKEVKAYKDAINDPDDIWCECEGVSDEVFKESGDSYLGVSKEGYVCGTCGKYTQIG